MGAWAKVEGVETPRERWRRTDGLTITVDRTPNDAIRPTLQVQVGEPGQGWQLTMVEHEFLLQALCGRPLDAAARAEVERHRIAGTHPAYRGDLSAPALQGTTEEILLALSEGIAMRSGPKTKNNPIQWGAHDRI